MQQPFITVKNISYTYPGIEGEVKAIDDLSFQVQNGEFLAIVGPSGCGKSTLLSIIARLLEPDSGTISFQNTDGSLHYPRIGYMLQHDYLLEWRSIYRNVTLGPEIKKKLTPETRAHIDKLLCDYGLFPFKDKKPSELSGGMRQRAALIRTLAVDPQLLLLDEPFSALDYQTRLSVADDICKIIRSTGKTAILITHDLSEAISMADRILVLSRRPATIKSEIPIHLTLTDTSTLAARKAPEFSGYFNQLWEELYHEKKKAQGELTTQEAFLKNHKKHKTNVLLLRILLLVSFLLLWEISARMQWIDSFFFASPSLVAECCMRMAFDGTLFANIGITLAETLISFFLVIAIGIGSATLLWYCMGASEVLEPYLVILNSLPKSALAPLFIVWLGTGMETIIVAGISVAVFGCIISIYTSFQQVDPEEMKLIYTLGGRKKDVFTKVVFPSSIPTILSTMKVNIGLALVGVIIGEFLAARRGLGYLIIYGSQVFNLHMVITSILILCLIAVLLYQAIRWVEKHYEKKL